MRLLLRRQSDDVYLHFRGRRTVDPYELRNNGRCVGLNYTQGLYVLAFFCHPILSEMDLMEIRWPDPDTMPDGWADCLRTETCTLNKLLARVGARIICRQGYYKMIESRALEMAA